MWRSFFHVHSYCLKGCSPRTKVKLKPAVPYLIFVLLFALVLVTLTVAALQVVVFGGLHHHLNSKNIPKLDMTHIICH